LPNPEYLHGKATIANAKLAYQTFNKIFSGDRWKVLTEKGTYVQRPLWASTGTKDPNYSDVKYVEPLIGFNTVNTLPEETIAAFADHGFALEDTILSDINSAEKVLSDLNKLGVDINNVARQLLDEGIKKFEEAYNTLLANLKEKRDKTLKSASTSKS
jgi:transaldolase